jgi:hypothetical protein
LLVAPLLCDADLGSRQLYILHMEVSTVSPEYFG